jgi:hypothetical protein
MFNQSWSCFGKSPTNFMTISRSKWVHVCSSAWAKSRTVHMEWSLNNIWSLSLGAKLHQSTIPQPKTVGNQWLELYNVQDIGNHRK